MAATGLVLRDIHQPPAPPWWPPAPGWWLVAAAVLAVATLAAILLQRRRRRRRQLERLFDATVEAVHTPPAQVAAMSELLRRAARQRDAGADRLQGEQWLAFLDADDPRRPFSDGVGRLLLDGGFRPSLPADAVQALRGIARTRFLQWMGVR